MPIHTKLLSWQFEQPPVTPAWICAPVGGGMPKAEPGAGRNAFAGTRPPGTLARWQLSQAVEEGMCELGPIGEVGGITTMLVMPAKVPAPMPGPWQSAQRPARPVWSICPPAKLLKPLSVEAMWQVPHIVR